MELRYSLKKIAGLLVVLGSVLALFVTYFSCMSAALAGTISVVNTSDVVDEDGNKTVFFNLHFTPAPDKTILVNVVEEGSTDQIESVPRSADAGFVQKELEVGGGVGSQGFNIRAVDDSVDETSPMSISLKITVAGSLDTTEYPVGTTTTYNSITVEDNDEAGITVDSISGAETTEGGDEVTFRVRLDTKPTADVKVPIASDNNAEAVCIPGELTFTEDNWSTRQTVRVVALNDDVVEQDKSYKVIISPPVSTDPFYGPGGLDPDDISLTNKDNDIAGVDISTISGEMTEEAENDVSFTVKLKSKPTDNVKVTFSNSQPSECDMSAGDLTFQPDNWNIPQTITLSGKDELIDDGDQSFSIVSSGAESVDPNYTIAGEQLDDVAVKVIDNDEAGIIVSTISGQTSEENREEVSFTVKLNSEPTSKVSIDFRISETSEGMFTESANESAVTIEFDNTDWNIAKTIKVKGKDEEVADGNTVFQIISDKAISSDNNYNEMEPDDVDVTNNDDDESGFVLVSNDGETDEDGDTAVFSVKLKSRPTHSVSISFHSDNTNEGTINTSSLSFSATETDTNAVGYWGKEQSVTVTGVDDDVKDGDVSYLIVTEAPSSKDPNYSGVSVKPENVSMTNKDMDETGFTIKKIIEHSSENGGTALFTVALKSAPTAEVQVNLASDNTLEGDVEPKTLTFTAGTIGSPQNVFVTGVDDSVDDGEVSFFISFDNLTSSDTDYNGPDKLPASVEIINDDDDTAGFTLSEINGNTSEDGDSASFKVHLDSKPTSNVSISFLSRNSSEGTVTSEALVFSPQNWQVDQTVTVTGADDLVIDGPVDYDVGTESVTTDDLEYKKDSKKPADFKVTNNDNDSAGFTVSKISGDVTEKELDASFTIGIDNRPSGKVTVALSSSDITEGIVEPTSVSFDVNDWESDRTVTVTGVNDAVDDGDISFKIITAKAVSPGDSNYNDVDPVDVDVVNKDDEDTAGFVFSVSKLETSEDGDQGTFTVRLFSEPTAKVTLGLHSDDTGEATVSPQVLEFTPENWSSSQEVTVTGVDDSVADGDTICSVVTEVPFSDDDMYDGGAANPTDIEVKNIDNDSAGFELSSISGNTSESGGTANFRIRLKSKPTADVTLKLSSSSTAEGTFFPQDPERTREIVFTPSNWVVPQVVTVFGVDDDVDDGNQKFNIITSDPVSDDANYNGASANPDDLEVINQDDDGVGVIVSNLSGDTTEIGGTAVFSVKLTSEPLASVSIGFSSADSTEGKILTPMPLVFTPENWSEFQVVTVAGVDDSLDDGDIVYLIESGEPQSSDPGYEGEKVKPVDVIAVNIDDNSAGFVISLISGNSSENGDTATFTVKLNSEPAHPVVLPITSKDTGEGTVSDVSLAFDSGNWNATQTVTVTGVDDSVDDGDVSYIIETGPPESLDPNYNGPGADPKDISVKNIDNDSVEFVVSGISGSTSENGGEAFFTVKLGSAPTSKVILGFTSSDVSEGVISPGTLTFEVSDWDKEKTVTVTGQDDALIDGDITYSIVPGYPSSSDSKYGDPGMKPADISVVNLDNDTPGFTVTQATGNTAEDGTAATFTVKLNSAPSANVSIGVVSSDTGEGTVSGSSITFTPSNWNDPYKITVTGQDDFFFDGDKNYSVEISPDNSTADSDYNGMDPGDVDLVNEDDDGGIVINEIFAAPAVDTNNDGVVDEVEDRFVEIVNNTGEDLDISGWTLADSTSARHTFPSGTLLKDQQAIVIFGGGSFQGAFGGSLVQIASNGPLALEESGGSITLSKTGKVMSGYLYGAEMAEKGGLVRTPDITGPDPMIATDSPTPGTRSDHSPFTTGNNPPVADPLIEDIVAVPSDPDMMLDLKNHFSDEEDDPEALGYHVDSVENTAAYSSIPSIAGGVLTLDFNPDYIGKGEITVRVVDSGGLTAYDTFSVSLQLLNRLTVLSGGDGGGTVTSSPDGIDCGSECVKVFSINTEITLAAAPDEWSVFTGWNGGGCSGTDPCVLIVDGIMTLTASFQLIDTDGDGLPDKYEDLLGSDKNDGDSDDDGISDGDEDINKNGVVDSGETDPGKADTDGDGVQDGTEKGLVSGSAGTDQEVFVPDADPSTTTDPVNRDTDGDGFSDGWEDKDKDGMVDGDSFEGDPNDKNPQFYSNSDIVDNGYFPVSLRDKWLYDGFGSLNGYGHYIFATDSEMVGDVKAVKVEIKGSGNDPDPDMDDEYTFFWLAQGANGSIWLKKYYTSKDDSTTLVPEADPVLWFPAQPEAGQEIMNYGDFKGTIEELGLELPNTQTGEGVYENTIKVKLTHTDTSGEKDLLLYFTPDVGIVKEEWVTEEKGWKLVQKTNIPLVTPSEPAPEPTGSGSSCLIGSSAGYGCRSMNTGLLLSSICFLIMYWKGRYWKGWKKNG